MELPNLAGIATQDLVEQIGGSGFKASYINWSRTMQVLREHAPGWLPVLGTVRDTSEIVHRAPVGGYLMIAFELGEVSTPFMPQAIMDHKNNAIPYDKITARDITDTHRRGICMAAAMTFGLAYELWAKLPMESGYQAEKSGMDEMIEKIVQADVKPDAGVYDSLSTLDQMRADKIAQTGIEYFDQGDIAGAHEYLIRAFGPDDPTEFKVAVNSLLDSKFRTALKKYNAKLKEEANAVR